MSRYSQYLVGDPALSPCDLMITLCPFGIEGDPPVLGREWADPLDFPLERSRHILADTAKALEMALPGDEAEMAGLFGPICRTVGWYVWFREKPPYRRIASLIIGADKEGFFVIFHTIPVDAHIAARRDKVRHIEKASVDLNYCVEFYRPPSFDVMTDIMLYVRERRCKKEITDPGAMLSETYRPMNYVEGELGEGSTSTTLGEATAKLRNLALHPVYLEGISPTLEKVRYVRRSFVSRLGKVCWVGYDVDKRRIMTLPSAIVSHEKFRTIHDGARPFDTSRTRRELVDMMIWPWGKLFTRANPAQGSSPRTGKNFSSPRGLIF